MLISKMVSVRVTRGEDPITRSDRKELLREIREADPERSPTFSSVGGETILCLQAYGGSKAEATADLEQFFAHLPVGIGLDFDLESMAACAPM